MSFINGTKGRVRGRLLGTGVVGAATLALALLAPRATNAEPASCLSTNPADWPAPSKPYFMLLVDTSGSMISCTTPPSNYPYTCNHNAAGYKLNSCGMIPTRINDAKCALRNTVQAFSGEANFGLATYAQILTGCSAGACQASCGNTGGYCPWEIYGCGVNNFPSTGSDCGNRPGCGSGSLPGSPNITFGRKTGTPWGTIQRRNGANVVVGLAKDNWWQATPNTSNVPEILKWFDGDCSDNKELFAEAGTPTADAMYSISQYFHAGWSLWTGDNQYGTAGNYCAPPPFTWSTPLDAQDRSCRSVNIILVTDGDPSSCSYGGSANANSAATATAQDLHNNGVTIGGTTWPVNTYVINFAGGTQANTDAIAQAGGTGSSLSANNETDLAVALSQIISGAAKPEICDNADNNCNGCTDEGYKHYCNENRTPSANPTQLGQCCSAARATCLTNYANSITAGNPQGDRWWLPCWTPAAGDPTPELKWLCSDPGEVCDNQDNNCDKTIVPANLGTNTADEGFNKCGSPAHCPQTETCNGQDDDCDSIIDNSSGSGVPYSICPGSCQPSAEICDGCDNDCDGIADNNIAAVSCGFTPPAWCAGQRTCQPQAVANPGDCVPGGGQFSACNNAPKTETCNGVDDDCNGLIDDGIAATACDVPGQPGLVYQSTFAQSQCKRGTKPCGGTCSGYVGPSTEICDGVDNDCDGVVDNGVPGVGQTCNAPCGSGTTACVGGTLICQTAVNPSPEVCDGVDNDCNGQVDDGVLQDAPANPGCWNTPTTGCGTVCNFKNLSWCRPAGATCNGVGSLTSPCQVGTLVCNGSNGWKCQGGTLPGPEVCDGVDNDCNGATDDGNLGAPVGDPCGSTCPVPNVGCPCTQGAMDCVNGSLTCVGGNNGTQETCNGKDDDCDGVVDNGINLGGSCTPTYDTTLYPGDRTKGACKPGTLACDPNSPTGTVCNGGVGPSPEICDGIDNDCDGQVDESGPAPDGIDGTANPNDASQHIGDACGSNVGECKPGTLACSGGQFVCTGGVGPQPEQCDCLDNNCDGQVDEDPGGDGGPALCSTGKSCVSFNGICQCAPPCGSGEFPCPTGTSCQTVPKSGTSQNGDYCVSDNCGDCSKKSAKDPKSGETVCGPAGTTNSTGDSVPLCVCKGNACKSPCDGISCPSGQSCVTSGPAAGICEPDNNCYFQGCPTGKICNDQSCVDDPCDPNPCQPDEVCKPSADFSTNRCVQSCAGVTCQSGEVCKEGQCQPTGCGTDCPPGQYCQGSADAGTAACGPSKCQSDGGLACANGATCNPITGACGNDPCEGVVCPAGQACNNGDCFTAQADGGPGGSGGTSGTGGSTNQDGGPDASGGTSGTGGKTAGEKPKGVWGLATGGGGCACRAGGGERKLPPAGMLLLGLGALGVFGRRRRRRQRDAGRAEGTGE